MMPTNIKKWKVSAIAGTRSIEAENARERKPTRTCRDIAL